MVESLDIDVLVVGAHADDIEIGAGAATARLAEDNPRLFILILTDEDDSMTKGLRRREAQAAAMKLGVPPDRVLFGGLPDGRLQADRVSVATIRKILTEAGVNPRLVISHSIHDSHNDHRAAAELTISSVRRACILHYAVPNSSVSQFSPRVFVDTTMRQEAKKAALREHKTQNEAGRILWSEMEGTECGHGERIGVKYAEAFELTVQQGAEDIVPRLRALNDCPFNQFWFGILGDAQLTNIHAVPVVRRKKSFDWPIDKDREGMAYLRRAFARYWHGQSPIDEFSCGTERVEQFLYNSHILLSGGAVSNSITRNYFNHFKGLRYIIDYDMPEYINIRIFDRERSEQITADYEDDEMGNRIPRFDRGILTIMRNQMAEGKALIGCMGIHGFGSLGCYKVLAEPILLREILMHDCLSDVWITHAGLQVIVEYDVRLERPRVDWGTIHKISRS